MNGLLRPLSTLALSVLVWAAPMPAQAAERIVSVGAAVTEILWDLGAAKEIVGVDTTSRHPAEALATLPDVGYFRRLSAEGLLSLTPTMIVAVAGSGPREVLDLVAGSGVRVVAIEEDWSLQGVTTKIDHIGALVGRPAEAAALAERVRRDVVALETARAARTTRPRVLFVLALTNGRPLVAGRATAADAMIDLAGGLNVACDFTGYKPLTDEAIIDAAPDVVVTMENGPESPTAEKIFALPAFALTPAARERRLIAVDGADLLAFGPRTPAIAAALMARFAP